MLQDFDPLAPEDLDSPHRVYAELRDRCPVAHSEAWGGFWALMKHADVIRAAADSDTYITSKQNVVPKVAFTGRRPRCTWIRPNTHPIAARSRRCCLRSGWRGSSPRS